MNNVECKMNNSAAPGERTKRGAGIFCDITAELDKWLSDYEPSQIFSR